MKEHFSSTIEITECRSRNSKLNGPPLQLQLKGITKSSFNFQFSPVPSLSNSNNSKIGLTEQKLDVRDLIKPTLNLIPNSAVTFPLVCNQHLLRPFRWQRSFFKEPQKESETYNPGKKGWKFSSAAKDPDCGVAAKRELIITLCAIFQTVPIELIGIITDYIVHMEQSQKMDLRSKRFHP